ncbi:MAG TPA: type II toxin-antitoxin system prevent-host-death family antitoxin [Bryobacteraceae bacterium]|jgi:prevent-host-death family protein
MEKASVRDLHIRTSELVKAASEGEVIIIERRGEPVAELRPVSHKGMTEERRKLVAKTFARMKPIWKRMPHVDTDSGRFLEEDRR